MYMLFTVNVFLLQTTIHLQPGILNNIGSQHPHLQLPPKPNDNSVQNPGLSSRNQSADNRNIDNRPAWMTQNTDKRIRFQDNTVV